MTSRAIVVAAWIGALGCGGTTGREGLPPLTEPSSSAPEATAPDGGEAEASLDATSQDDTAFDVTITYADRFLPDVSPPPEAGPDEGTADAGLQPCTSARQTGCVECQGNVTDAGDAAPPGPCTPTEALLVAYDIAEGTATAPGPDPDASCYACLVASGYIDDNIFMDSQQECGDLPSESFTAGNGNIESYQAACLDTLRCILTTHCSVPVPDAGLMADVSNCYCGPGGGTAMQCKQKGPATNGACKTAETNGFPYDPSDSMDIVNQFNTTSYPSGIANTIFVQALGVCPQCFQ